MLVHNATVCYSDINVTLQWLTKMSDKSGFDIWHECHLKPDRHDFGDF